MAFRVRMLERADYEPVWRAMQEFTEQRTDDTADELWLVEHPPVYTLGMNGDAAHILDAGDVPVVRTDRGGQVTYHGPGQLVLYALVDLQRRKLGVRRMVSALEESVVALLRQYGLSAQARSDAPGVYVQGAKIASLGLRVRRGCCYHGVALNVRPELEAFGRINPCGYAGLPVTRLADLGVDAQVFEPAAALVRELMVQLGDEEIEI
ncbi:lipoyl(octanoyl) transferase LipB [Methylococcus mesophilus]|uniref:lipoyl(octanoyl) transferase LipB n=1 Tax=Methylococcus mesophilus TaxID=2993564 RepID=UPI00224A619D|nr:lipoyl(octanoyl) transferase LipB [Methylococcus mesophilus]UZR27502.1 lipoyl(octanoyl) transferase LipB [Methylococcus mesophilus]